MDDGPTAAGVVEAGVIYCLGLEVAGDTYVAT